MGQSAWVQGRMEYNKCSSKIYTQVAEDKQCRRCAWRKRSVPVSLLLCDQPTLVNLREPSRHLTSASCTKNIAVAFWSQLVSAHVLATFCRIAAGHMEGGIWLLGFRVLGCRFVVARYQLTGRNGIACKFAACDRVSQVRAPTNQPDWLAAAGCWLLL